MPTKGRPISSVSRESAEAEVGRGQRLTQARAKLGHDPERHRMFSRDDRKHREARRLADGLCCKTQKYRLNKILAKVSSSPVLVRGTF